MALPFSVGEILLDLICVSIMLYFLSIGLTDMNATNDAANRNMYASEYQSEYAKFSVYEGSDIAYTEVLECIYTHASASMPIYIVPTWADFNRPADVSYNAAGTQIQNGLSYTSFTVAYHRNPPTGASVTALPASSYDFYNRSIVWKTNREQSYKEISDITRLYGTTTLGYDTTRPYQGRIVRHDNGKMVAIVFTRANP